MPSEPLSVKQCLVSGMVESGLPRLEAQMLLAHTLGQSRVWLIAHDDHVLSDTQVGVFKNLCQRRVAGEPMAYLMGEREFMGLTFEVSPAVLIPRPETELLVQTALDLVADLVQPCMLDLGTGSGAIAVALAHARPDARIWATDISQAALELAQRNADRNAVTVEFALGSWFDALRLTDFKFDLIVSNPPYIAAGDDHLNQGDLRFEPRAALTDEADGLSAYRIIVAGARNLLTASGHLCVEHGFEQGPAVSGLFQQGGFLGVKTIQDLAGLPRVTAGSYNG
ncbi:MAG: peptide chain release factor N(5)-glutamine methyltransferase [Burkholderiaceae bacterium]|nr:peptide chain release factor N(5)-glutamine methyltransferase [Burkholderiaceae bacterium]MCD8536501.1 peptide chain release factor N(5)-glutamine methyltransferase [Burkholderiaceae bacterium]